LRCNHERKCGRTLRSRPSHLHVEPGSSPLEAAMLDVQWKGDGMSTTGPVPLSPRHRAITRFRGAGSWVRNGAPACSCGAEHSIHKRYRRYMIRKFTNVVEPRNDFGWLMHCARTVCPAIPMAACRWGPRHPTKPTLHGNELYFNRCPHAASRLPRRARCGRGVSSGHPMSSIREPAEKGQL